MSNSYGGDPSANSRDAVRFWISDRGPTTWEFSDQEIDYVLTLKPDPVLAAAWCAAELSAKYAGAVDKSVGDLRISYSRKAQAYQELADRLTSQSERLNVTMYIGGVSLADMCGVSANSDRNKPPFSIKQFDIPGGENSLSNTELEGD